MALDFLAVPEFPNVPLLAGVPPLARSAVGFAVGPQITRLTTDVGIVQSLLGLGPTPHWGIYANDTRTPVLTGDAVIALAPTAEMHVSDAPMEDGGFQSYNKVALPQEALVTIAKGGKQAEREAFVSQLDALRTSLTLYSVVAPDMTLKNMNVVGVRFERTAREGAQLIIADLRLREIRLAPPPAFSKTKAPTAAAVQDGGPVQATPPTTPQAVSGTVQ